MKGQTEFSMPFQFFTGPVRDDGNAADELNSFLHSHRILAIDRRWVNQGNDSFWAICVDYHAGGDSSSKSGKRSRDKDYKEILNPEDFGQFAVLRDLLKELAQQESVPVHPRCVKHESTVGLGRLR
jgi:hypothetical protein